MSLKSASKSRYYPQLAKDIHSQIKEETRYVRDALYDLRDSSQWQIQNLTLSRNLAFNPDVTPGKPLLLIAQQDAVGGFTLTFDPKFKGTTPTVAPAANAFTLSLFYPKSESEVLTIAGGGGGGGGVPPTRLIATTLPLTGGGDLSADRTLGINVFTAAVRGAVPPPGVIVGNVLSDSGAWIALAGGGTVTSVGSGTGIDAVPNPIVGVGVLNLATRAANSIMGNNTGGALAPLDLTGTQVTAMLDIFTASGVGHLKGLVPDPGAVGGNTKFLREDASWQAVSAAAHAILSATHSDTLAAGVVDGDVIIGNVTPAWSRLAIAIPAANVRNVLGIDNGELRSSWKTALDGTAPTTIGVSDVAAAGTSLVFAHRDHQHGSPATFPAVAHNILSATHGDTLADSVVQGDVIFGNATPKWERLAANATATNKFLRSVSGGVPSWEVPAAAPHNIFSVSHSDTTGAASPVDGDIVIANVTPLWSKLAIAIPAADVRNVLGVDNGELRPSWKTALDGTAPTTISASDVAAAGTSLVFAHRDHLHGSPATFPATAHNLLSATHGDTTADAVVQGDLVYGDAAPKWVRLAANATATKKYLQSVSGAIPSWQQVAIVDLSSAFTLGSVIFAGVGGALSEDNANFFWDATKHYLGLGITAPLVKLHESETKTLAASPADDYSAGIRQAPAYTGAFTVSRHNYLDLLTPTVAAGAAVTEAAVMRFDAAKGTHKALLKDAYVAVNENATLRYLPMMGGLFAQPLNKNFLHNANFNIWQRGTTQVSLTSGVATYMADRWVGNHTSDAVFKMDQETAVLPTVAQSGVKSNYSLKLSCTTADAAIAAGQFAALGQKVEGFDAQKLMGRVITLSFWAYSSKAAATGSAPAYCVAFRNSGTNRSYVAEYHIEAANTWEKKSITLTMLDGTAGTWDFTTGIGVSLNWGLACGATFQAANNADWETGNFLGTANQVNWLDSNTAVFYISQVQLEIGGVATDFEPVPVPVDLANCQRYCHVVQSDGTITQKCVGHGSYASTTVGVIVAKLPATMRAVPALTATAADWQVDDGVTLTTLTSISLVATTSSPDIVSLLVGSGAITAFRPYRLNAKTTAVRTMIFSSEL